MAPVEASGRMAALMYPVPAVAEAPVLAPCVDADAEITSILARLRAGVSAGLDGDEARVLRACLRLAGEPLPLRGVRDQAFDAALTDFCARQGLTGQQGLLDDTIVQAVLAESSRAIGAPERLRSIWRRSWFDAFEAPALLAELSGLAVLIRCLRRGA